MEWLDRTEIIRGGGALLFGPMPGGVIHYRQRSAKTGEKLRGTAGFRAGSFGSQTYSLEAAGSLGDSTGGLAQFQRRLSDGFRSSNGGYDISQGRLQGVQEIGAGQRLTFSGLVYRSIHGEAGGIASPASERLTATTPNDRLTLERTFGSIEYRNERTSGLLFTSSLFGGSFDRDSYRQNLGSATQFGGTPNADSNTIQKQNFKTLALDSRLKWDHSFLSPESTLSAGLLLYAVDSPFIQEQGGSAVATNGTPQKNLDRKTRAISLSFEERLEWERFSLTPGLRIENLYQSIRENLNSGSSVPNRSNSEWVHVPLFGIGAEAKIDQKLEAYLNFSQSYRAMAFQDTLPLANGDLVSEDLKPAKAWTLEAGVRDRLSERLTWDLSAFLISYSDQFGRDGNVLKNTGAAVHQGVEASYDLELLSGALGDLHWVGNLTALHARFKEGSFSGKTPQYAPKWILKNGLYSRFGSSNKLSLQHQYISDHFGDDGNSVNRKIPSYRVVDLTIESKIPGTRFEIFAGVFNLLDERYFSRVRSNGIDPAMPRNLSLGITARL
jgi:Fe(3+) dicitrate transport protein